MVDGPGGAGVVYRRLDGPESSPDHGPVAVSPPGVVTSAGGETPPVLQFLPDGTLVAAYTVPLPGRWQNRILLQRSTDGGATWSAPRPLPNGGDPGSQHQLSAAAVTGAATGSDHGGLVLAWLESRNGVRGLRAARTRDGERFEPDRAVDGKTCECCGTAARGLSAIAALAAPGRRRRRPVWLAYRDVDDGDRRDIHLAASRDGGATFAPPRPVSPDGWKLPGCPDQGPRLAEAPGGALWAAWFTGAEPGVYAAGVRGRRRDLRAAPAGRRPRRRPRQRPPAGDRRPAGRADRGPLPGLPDGRRPPSGGAAPRSESGDLERSSRDRHLRLLSAPRRA